MKHAATVLTHQKLVDALSAEHEECLSALEQEHEDLKRGHDQVTFHLGLRLSVAVATSPLCNHRTFTRTTCNHPTGY